VPLTNFTDVVLFIRLWFGIFLSVIFLLSSDVDSTFEKATEKEGLRCAYDNIQVDCSHVKFH
jgi:hypothetical protein